MIVALLVQWAYYNEQMMIATREYLMARPCVYGFFDVYIMYEMKLMSFVF